MQSVRSHNIRLAIVLEVQIPLHDWQVEVWIDFSVEIPKKCALN